MDQGIIQNIKVHYRKFCCVTFLPSTGKTPRKFPSWMSFTCWVKPGTASPRRPSLTASDKQTLLPAAPPPSPRDRVGRWLWPRQRHPPLKTTRSWSRPRYHSAVHRRRSPTTDVRWTDRWRHPRGSQDEQRVRSYACWWQPPWWPPCPYINQRRSSQSLRHYPRLSTEAIYIIA